MHWAAAPNPPGGVGAIRCAATTIFPAFPRLSRPCPSAAPNPPAGPGGVGGARCARTGPPRVLGARFAWYRAAFLSFRNRIVQKIKAMQTSGKITITASSPPFRRNEAVADTAA